MRVLIVRDVLKAGATLIDRAVALDRGSVVAEGAYSDVSEDPAVRASYLGGA